MNYKYMHDTEGRVLYRFPALPNIIEQKQGGVRTGWRVQMDIIITHAQNRLVNNRLEHPTSENAEQDFARHYERDQVISFFYSHHSPKGTEISKAEYDQILNEYGVVEGNRR